jgi:hypothetical protein
MLNCLIKADMYITFVFFTSGCVRGFVRHIDMYITCIDNPSGTDRWMTHKNIDVFKVFFHNAEFCSGFFALQVVEIVTIHKYM